MIIESIEAVAGNRSRIRLDNGEKFILYKGEIHTLKLKENADISDNVYMQITRGILTKRSKLRALNLLKARDYTEYQLRKKLIDAEYPSYIVDQTMDYVKSFGYIDDSNYAASYIMEQIERKSRKEIVQKLQLKGISKVIIEDVFEKIAVKSGKLEEDLADSETEIIVKMLLKKKYTGAESYEEKQKFLAYFYRKGFEVDSIYEAMNRISQSL